MTVTTISPAFGCPVDGDRYTQCVVTLGYRNYGDTVAHDVVALVMAYHATCKPACKFANDSVAFDDGGSWVSEPVSNCRPPSPTCPTVRTVTHLVTRALRPGESGSVRIAVSTASLPDIRSGSLDVEFSTLPPPREFYAFPGCARINYFSRGVETFGHCRD